MRSEKRKRNLLLGVACVAALFSVGVDCGGGGTEPKPRPIISLVSVSNTDIMPGESVVIGFTTLYADSVLLFPGGSSVNPFDTAVVTVPLSEPGPIRLIAVNSEGLDTLMVVVTMSGATASIDVFSLSSPTILQDDSTLLSWSVTNADSLVIDNGLGTFTSLVDSLWLKPTVTTTYRATAYNLFNATASVIATVQIPGSVEAPDGLYYKSVMASSVADPALSFIVKSTEGGLMNSVWIYFELIEGDGTLSADSLLSNAASPTYQFSGSIGHAVIRAKLPGIDSVDVYLRANTLIPGPGGQGQYILFDNAYAWVVTYNGAPDRIDQDPTYSNLFYAVYEQNLGLVVMAIDQSGNGQIEPGEPLLGFIVNTVYDKTTPEGIGIGSAYQAMTTAYGAPDTSYLDPAPPAADVYIYDSIGITFFANPVDSLIFEMHLIDPTPAAAPGPSPGLNRTGRSEALLVKNRPYKLHLSH